MTSHSFSAPSPLISQFPLSPLPQPPNASGRDILGGYGEFCDWILIHWHYSTASLQPGGFTYPTWSSAQCRLLKHEKHCEAAQQFFVSLPICSLSLPQAWLWMCAGMESRYVMYHVLHHTTGSRCVAHTVPLFWHVYAQLNSDFRWGSRDISTIVTLCLVTCMVN